MRQYLINLAALVFGAFIATLLGLMLADGAFNAWTFDWVHALEISGSTALLALVKGLAARFVGDSTSTSLRS